MSKINKSEHDKTNKPVHPAKTQPGHLPSLIRGISVCLKKVWVLNPFGADTLADLSPCWVHMLFCCQKTDIQEFVTGQTRSGHTEPRN